LRVDRRGAGLVLGVVAAVTLVALASRGDHGGDRAILSVSSAATSAWQTTLLVVLALLIVGVVVLMVASLSVHKPDPDSSRPRSWVRVVATLVIVLGFAVAMSRARPHRTPQVVDSSAGTSVSDGTRAPAPEASGGSPAWGIGVAGALLVVGAAAGVAYATRTRRDAASPLPAPIVATPDERDDAVARAHACADPREAVLLAFAAAEAVLSGDAATRRPPATSAREWSSRVRLAPLSTIVGRYEIARFSDHPVTDRDRTMALDALAVLA
jgi:protein-S-isoprenylcysteine O-methyltransferase Ste14